jgi:hypothetical protein
LTFSSNVGEGSDVVPPICGGGSSSDNGGSCDNEKCPPCKLIDGTIVPVGTIGYRYDVVDGSGRSTGHYPIEGSHYQLLKANQNPNNCQCFWQPLKHAVASPPPGSIEAKPFAN